MEKGECQITVLSKNRKGAGCLIDSRASLDQRTGKARCVLGGGCVLSRRNPAPSFTLTQRSVVADLWTIGAHQQHENEEIRSDHPGGGSPKNSEVSDRGATN
jgi:hypothetical protein